MLAVFEGWDAAGKGGAIKRVTRDARAARLHGVLVLRAAGRGEDAIITSGGSGARCPRAGHLGIFDRSYYGRVLVERVEGFCSEEEWRRAYREINEFEAHQASFGHGRSGSSGCTSRKEEQLRRFRDRERDPFRSHKLTAEDWRNRARWKRIRGARWRRCWRAPPPPHAPWTVVEADDKLHARVKVVQTLADAIEKALG